MYNAMVDKYYKGSVDEWEQLNPRFMRLKMLDLWLDGKFYDKIQTDFWQEEGGNGDYIPLICRMPAVQHNIPKLVARLCAHKLFAGRHVPRLKHEDETVQAKLQGIVDLLHIPASMIEAVKFGSVGSVLLLFKFLPVGETVKGAIEVVRSYHATPRLDEFGELIDVMIHYITKGFRLKELGFTACEGKPIIDSEKYWYVRKIDNKSDIIYNPLAEHRWNPVNKGPGNLTESKVTNHELGFVPGIWIKNMPGGMAPDGECTWESGLNNFIEYDYMASQIGRGLFYSAAPQLVIKGDMLNVQESQTGQIRTGPVNCIQLAPDQRDAMGGTITGHDAKLLETTGEGLKCGLDFNQTLKHATLEQISVSRKDLETIKGSMSGKAMELIDQEFLDLIQELRVQYCEFGYLPLIKKICNAAIIAKHPAAQGLTPKSIDALELQYAAMYTPDEQGFLYIVQALDIAVNGSHPKPVPQVSATGQQLPMPEPSEPLLDVKDARAYLASIMDLSLTSVNLPATQLAANDDLPPPVADEEPSENKTDKGGMMETLAKTPKQGHFNPGLIPY
jgi:hypothetical protein